MGNKELEEHQARVEAFGGRIDSPAKPTMAELSKTVLGSVKTLPTAGAVAISAAPITLAEMNVSHPIAVDVSFSYLNINQGQGIGDTLDVGDGFVQITWGVKGAIEQTAQVDGGFGWRFPFVASHLLVQYFPVDQQSNAGKIIPIGQSRNLQIAGMIAPASGAPCAPLTKTVRFSDIAPGASEQQQVPKFAYEWRTELITNFASTWDVGFFTPPATQIYLADANGVAGEYPTWQLPGHWWTVPQAAPIVNLGIDLASPVALIEPAIKFRLAL